MLKTAVRKPAGMLGRLIKRPKCRGYVGVAVPCPGYRDALASWETVATQDALVTNLRCLRLTRLRKQVPTAG
jgi:hypothetical protein